MKKLLLSLLLLSGLNVLSAALDGGGASAVDSRRVVTFVELMRKGEGVEIDVNGMSIENVRSAIFSNYPPVLFRLTDIKFYDDGDVCSLDLDGLKEGDVVKFDFKDKDESIISWYNLLLNAIDRDRKGKEGSWGRFSRELEQEKEGFENDLQDLLDNAELRFGMDLFQYYAKLFTGPVPEEIVADGVRSLSISESFHVMRIACNKLASYVEEDFGKKMSEEKLYIISTTGWLNPRYEDPSLDLDDQW